MTKFKTPAFKRGSCGTTRLHLLPRRGWHSRICCFRFYKEARRSPDHRTTQRRQLSQHQVVELCVQLPTAWRARRTVERIRNDQTETVEVERDVAAHGVAANIEYYVESIQNKNK